MKYTMEAMPRELMDVDFGDQIIVKFSDSDQKVLIRDEFCSNPKCDCTEGVLRFFELSLSGHVLNEMFQIKIDVKTWEIKETIISNILINAEEMIEEFIDGLDGVKDTLLKHYKRSKGLNTDNAMDFMTKDIEDMILEGLVLGYEEIFGIEEMISFSMDSVETWTIDDQYCSNPKCLCNEGVLTFFKVNRDKYEQEPAFSVRMNIKNYAYDVEYNEVGTEKITEVMDHLKAHEPELLKTIYNRYHDVKEVSKAVIKKHRNNQMQAQTKIKVGRNDPCPCGSNKKYKKCCGK